MSTLSEHASKALLAEHGVPLAREADAADAAGAVRVAESIGFPVAVKLSGDGIAHKTERGLVRLGLADAEAVRAAAEALLAQARPEDGDVRLLVAEMVGGARELIAGVARDPQFGACVLLGLGGILTEAVGDAVFAVAPVSGPRRWPCSTGWERSACWASFAASRRWTGRPLPICWCRWASWRWRVPTS